MAGRVLALFFAWVALALAATGAHAQTAPSAKAQLDQVQTEIKDLWRKAAGAGADKAKLSQLYNKVAPIQTEIQQAVDPLQQQLNAVDQLLSPLGPPPKPGAPPEAPDIAHKRKALSAQYEALDDQIKRGGELAAEAKLLATQLANQRIDYFSERISERAQSILDPALWRDVAAKLPDDAGRWVGLIEEQVDTARAASPRAFGLAGLFLVLALVLAIPARILLKRAALRLSLLRRASARLREAEIAAATVIVRAAMPVLATALLVYGLKLAGLLAARVEELGWAFVWAVGMAAAAYALGRTLLAPRRAELRLSAISDGTAAALSPYPLILSVAAAAGMLVLRANKVAGVSLSTAVAARAVIAAADLVILALAASAVGRARAAEYASQEETGGAERGQGLWTLALFVVWMAVIAGGVALLLGYIMFAVFLTWEIVWIGIVSGITFVLTNLTDAFCAELAPERGVVGRFMASSMGVGSRTLDQVSVLLAGVARLVLWLLALAVILTPFGAGTDEMFTHLQAGVTSFKLGGVTVAPVAIAASIGIFVVGLVLTRMFRRWLEAQYLPRTRLDAGLSATFATGVSYVGGVIALLVASGYLGLQLTQVTLIASALTVGVGFGLQSVIQNFVAGLILLAGRPIRVGDWIAVGGQEGDVQRINVRATEIKLFDGSMLILPNQELVTKPVRNVTWGAPLGQVQINFTIGYDADLDVVTATLMDVFKQTRGVLKDPAPSVLLSEFRDLGAAFTGYAYVATPRAVSRTRSDILLEFGRRLREAGIRPGVELQQAVISTSARGRIAQS